MKSISKNNALRKEILDNYIQEMAVFRQLDNILQNLDNEIMHITENLRTIHKKRDLLEDSFLIAGKTEKQSQSADSFSGLEINDIEKKYQNKISKLQEYRNNVEKRAIEVLRRLRGNEYIIKPPAKENNLFIKFFTKWINTMRITYSEAYRI